MKLTEDEEDVCAFVESALVVCDEAVPTLTLIRKIRDKIERRTIVKLIIGFSESVVKENVM